MTIEYLIILVLDCFQAAAILDGVEAWRVPGFIPDRDATGKILAAAWLLAAAITRNSAQAWTVMPARSWTVGTRRGGEASRVL